MNVKIVNILITMMLITTTTFSVAAITYRPLNLAEKNLKNESIQNPIEISKDGWILQWSHEYGGYGHAQHAQPVGDIDEDGINEVILGGYGSQGAHILYYNEYTETYEEEHFWNYPGGEYNGIPSGVCVIDLGSDGDLDFVASFEYGGKNGIIAYDWDGNILSQLDYYYGQGYDFAFDVYACDYDDDGVEETIIANAPEYGTGVDHVTALEWVNGAFVHSTGWRCTDTNQECPMVWSGDPDNDGNTEIIAACSESLAAYILSYDGSNFIQEAKISVGTNVYAVSMGDLDNDGIDEIGIGGFGPDAYIYKFQDGEYVRVWSRIYGGEEGVIEGITIGDADNDGINEFLVGTDIVHVIQWNQEIEEYVEEATLTESTGRLAGVIIGDCDSDGVNEVKATEIFGGPSKGREFIYKYMDDTPPITTCELDGVMKDDFYISDVTVHINAYDDYSVVEYTMFKLNEGEWELYEAPFILSEDGTYTLKFYSVDSYGNKEEEKSVIFTIKHSCCYLIEIPKGFAIGIKASVTELNNEEHNDIFWRFEVSGADIIAITPLSGKFDILAGETKTLKSLLVFGIGRIHVKVTIDECEPISSDAFIFGVFVLNL